MRRTMREVTVTFVASERLKTAPFQCSRVDAKAVCVLFAVAKKTVCAKPQPVGIRMAYKNTLSGTYMQSRLSRLLGGHTPSGSAPIHDSIARPMMPDQLRSITELLHARQCCPLRWTGIIPRLSCTYQECEMRALTLTVCMQTFATFAGIDTSEKKAAGPPGWFRSVMKPSMRRWKPKETCVVENKNIITAVPKIILFTFACLRL